jgi:YggT family protein
MGTEILVSTLQMLSMFYLTIVVLRFLFQLCQVDYFNPISQFIAKATNPVTQPIRSIIPPVQRFDFASLIFAILFQALMYVIILSIAGYGFTPAVLMWGVLKVAGLIINIYFFAIIAMIVISWIAPGNTHPGIQLIHQITEPIMAPFRGLLPPMGGLDLSPILVFLVLNMVMVVMRNLEAAAGMPF